MTNHKSFLNLSFQYKDEAQNITLETPIRISLKKDNNTIIFFVREVILDKKSPFFCYDCQGQVSSLTMIVSEFFDKFFTIKIRLHPNYSYEIYEKEKLLENLKINDGLCLTLVTALVQEVLKQLSECGTMETHGRWIE